MSQFLCMKNDLVNEAIEGVLLHTVAQSDPSRSGR